MINSLVNLLISIVFNFNFYKNAINFGFAISYNSASFIVHVLLNILLLKASYIFSLFFIFI